MPLATSWGEKLNRLFTFYHQNRAILTIYHSCCQFHLHLLVFVFVFVCMKGKSWTGFLSLNLYFSYLFLDVSGEKLNQLLNFTAAAALGQFQLWMFTQSTRLHAPVFVSNNNPQLWHRLLLLPLLSQWRHWWLWNNYERSVSPDYHDRKLFKW